MARIIVYRNYPFRLDKDPIIDALRTVIKGEEKLKNRMVHEISGVATATLDNWFDGDTRKPQNATVVQVTGALGYARQDDIDRRTGRVIVGFRKVIEIDRKREIEKQADFFLKHHPAAKKRKRKKAKANGHAK